MRSLSRMSPLLLVLVAVAACGSEDEEPTPTPPDAPVARISGPGSGEIGTQAIFSGEESEGTGSLRFHWTLEPPEGSSASLALEGEAKTAFTPDVGGTYHLRLVVEDDVGESAPATHDLHVLFPEPTAALSLRPTEAMVGEEIVADGSESTDPSGLPLTYDFRLSKRPSGSATAFHKDGAVARFTPDRPGLYEVTLTVSNGSTQSEAVQQSIEVDPAPIQPPVAVVGPEQSGILGTLVRLNGSGSHDPNTPPLPLTYHWNWVKKPDGSEAELIDEDTARPGFEVDALGEYEIELVVDNGTYESEPVVAKVVGVEKPNAKPTVTLAIEGGGDPIYQVDDTVVFVATAHDVDGDPISLEWELERPDESEAELEETDAENQRSLTVDAGGAYTVKVTAYDGKDRSDPSTVVIHALGPYTPPVADPGEDQSVPNGTTVHLDGTGSSHHDPRDELTYQWSFESRPSGSQANFETGSTVAKPRFTPDRKGQFVVGLIVSDGTESSEKATVTITSENRPPVAHAGRRNVNCNMDQMEPGDDPENPNPSFGGCALDGTGSHDPDGDPLTYVWEVVDGPAGHAATFSEPPGSYPSFFTDVPGVYKVRLTVADGDGGEHSDEITVTVDD